MKSNHVVPISVLYVALIHSRQSHTAQFGKYLDEYICWLNESCRILMHFQFHCTFASWACGGSFSSSELGAPHFITGTPNDVVHMRSVQSTGARDVGKGVLMAENVRSPFDYREPPTLDSDGDGSKPPPPRGWVRQNREPPSHGG